ncbi:MAG: hypothetical protein R3E39_24855 [Anaerolineae bacterium]
MSRSKISTALFVIKLDVLRQIGLDCCHCGLFDNFKFVRAEIVVQAGQDVGSRFEFQHERGAVCFQLFGEERELVIAESKIDAMGCKTPGCTSTTPPTNAAAPKAIIGPTPGSASAPN